MLSSAIFWWTFVCLEGCGILAFFFFLLNCSAESLSATSVGIVRFFCFFLTLTFRCLMERITLSITGILGHQNKRDDRRLYNA